MIQLPRTNRLTTEPPSPGMYLDVPADVYHSWRAVSQSLLTVVHTETLAHAREYMNGDGETTQAQSFGSAYHAMVMESETFDQRFRVWSGKPRNTKEGRADYEAALATVNGDASRLVRAEDIVDMRLMHAALRKQTRTRNMICIPGAVEACIVWKDEETGLACKARLDKLLPSPHDIILDLKSARSAHPEKFAKSAADFGYDIQAGFYVDGVRIVTGRDCAFVFIPQEKERPFLSSLITASDGCDPSAVDIGRRKYRTALNALASALESDNWPGYGDQPFGLQIPAWAIPAPDMSEV